jgi:hypothetical protein
MKGLEGSPNSGLIVLVDWRSAHATPGWESVEEHQRLYTKLGGRSGSATSQSRLGRLAGEKTWVA